jgi:hypothetical protein
MISNRIIYLFYLSITPITKLTLVLDRVSTGVILSLMDHRTHIVREAGAGNSL